MDFNKNTAAQYIKDQFMQLALMCAIGLPLLALIIWIMDTIGPSWWFWAWAVLISFSLLNELVVSYFDRTAVQQIYTA